MLVADRALTFCAGFGAGIAAVIGTAAIAISAVVVYFWINDR